MSGKTSLPAADLQLLVIGVNALEATELPSCLAAELFYLMEPRGKLIIYYYYCFAVYWDVELGIPSFISWFLPVNEHIRVGF